MAVFFSSYQNYKVGDLSCVDCLLISSILNVYVRNQPYIFIQEAFRINRKKVGIRIIVSALAAIVLVLGTAGIGAAGPSPVSEAKADGVRTGIHPETGMLAFVGAEPSAPIGVAGAVGEGIPAQTRASAILQAYAPQFGVANPAEELTVLREKEADGRQIIRYQQVYRGIPVLGGELILN